MRNQTRIVIVMALAALLAAATGTVLLFGYAIAALSCTAVIVVGTKRLVKHVRGWRFNRPTATLPISRITGSGRRGTRRAA